MTADHARPVTDRAPRSRIDAGIPRELWSMTYVLQRINILAQWTGNTKGAYLSQAYEALCQASGCRYSTDILPWICNAVLASPRRSEAEGILRLISDQLDGSFGVQKTVIALSHMTVDDLSRPYAESAQRARMIASLIDKLIECFAGSAVEAQQGRGIEYIDFPDEARAGNIRSMMEVLRPNSAYGLVKSVRYNPKRVPAEATQDGWEDMGEFYPDTRQLVIFPGFFYQEERIQKAYLVHEVYGHPPDFRIGLLKPNRDAKKKVALDKALVPYIQQLISIRTLWDPFKHPASEYVTYTIQQYEAGDAALADVWDEQFAEIMQLLYEYPNTMRGYFDQWVIDGFTRYLSEALGTTTDGLEQRFENLRLLKLQKVPPDFPRVKPTVRAAAKQAPVAVQKVTSDEPSRSNTRNDQAVSAARKPDHVMRSEDGLSVTFNNFDGIEEDALKLSTFEAQVRAAVAEVKPNTNASRILRDVRYEPKQRCITIDGKSTKVIADFNSATRTMTVYEAFFGRTFNEMVATCRHEIFGHGTQIDMISGAQGQHASYQRVLIELKNAWDPALKPMNTIVTQYVQGKVIFDGVQAPEQNAWHEQWAYMVMQLCDDAAAFIQKFGKPVYDASVDYLAAVQQLEPAVFVARNIHTTPKTTSRDSDKPATRPRFTSPPAGARII